MISPKALLIGLAILAIGARLFAAGEGMRPPGLKTALNLGGHSGVRIGVEVNPNRTGHWQNFINLDALYNQQDKDLVGGLNLEFRKIGESRFYPVFGAGLDVYPVSYRIMTNWQFPDEDPVWEDRRGKKVLPHLTAGGGYKTEIRDETEFFVELDAGLSAQLISLRLGFVF